MPYIKTVTNVPIPKEKMEAIKTQVGSDSAILGKSENWLMVDFCENSPLYFGGSDAPAAMVQVDLYGRAGDDAYGEMTAALTRLLTAQLDIPADRVFVKYQEYRHWGWNGRNF